MKKLTAGIFATILGLTTVNAFAANQDGVASTQYVRGAMGAAVSTANAYTDTKVSGVNTALDGYMKVDAFNSFKTENTAAIESAASAAQTAATNAAASDATTKANAAREAAISAAATDATTKANAAEANAKAYTNQKVGALPEGFENVVVYVNDRTADIASNAELQSLQNTIGGHTSAIYNLETAVADKQKTLTADQLNAVNSGITAAKVESYDAYNGRITTAEGVANTASTTATNAQNAATAAANVAGEAKTIADDAAEIANAANTAATNASTTAGEAKQLATNASTTATNAKNAADKATADVETLTTTVNGKLDTTTAEATYATKVSVSDLAGDVSENATAISNLQTASATHATKAEVKAVDDKFANYVLVSSVVNEYKPAN